MKYIWTDKTATRPTGNKRGSERRVVALPGRLTWKDQRGTTRFASVVTRDVSDFGVYVECQSIVSIPMYRLVQFQLEQSGTPADAVPAALRQGRVLSAVYRVTTPTRSAGRSGFALRLMVDPKRAVAELTETRATA